MKKTLTLLILLFSICIGFGQTAQESTKENKEKEQIPEIFKKHEWLQKIVDYKDCQNITIQDYENESGHHKYVFIEEDGIKRMYTPEGKSYCTDNANLSCIEFYKLNAVGEKWACKEK